MTQENELLGLQTESLEAMAKQLVWMSSTSLWSWVGMWIFPRHKDLDEAKS